MLNFFVFFLTQTNFMHQFFPTFGAGNNEARGSLFMGSVFGVSQQMEEKEGNINLSFLCIMQINLYPIWVWVKAILRFGIFKSENFCYLLLVKTKFMMSNILLIVVSQIHRTRQMPSNWLTTPFLGRLCHALTAQCIAKAQWTRYRQTCSACN